MRSLAILKENGWFRTLLSLTAIHFLIMPGILRAETCEELAAISKNIVPTWKHYQRSCWELMNSYYLQCVDYEDVVLGVDTIISSDGIHDPSEGGDEMTQFLCEAKKQAAETVCIDIMSAMAWETRRLYDEWLRDCDPCAMNFNGVNPYDPSAPPAQGTNPRIPGCSEQEEEVTSEPVPEPDSLPVPPAPVLDPSS